jgi:hypothetical protein
MAQRRHQPILIGDRVRSYVLPGMSDHDYITGTVVGYCQIAGLPRLIVESESRTTHGQEEPCRRTFLEPLDGIAEVRSAPRPPLTFHQVA